MRNNVDGWISAMPGCFDSVVYPHRDDWREAPSTRCRLRLTIRYAKRCAVSGGWSRRASHLLHLAAQCLASQETVQSRETCVDIFNNSIRNTLNFQNGVQIYAVYTRYVKAGRERTPRGRYEWGSRQGMCSGQALNALACDCVAHQ